MWLEHSNVVLHLVAGLDGSTTAQERERLINLFNSNTSEALLFLLSTRLVLVRNPLIDEYICWVSSLISGAFKMKLKTAFNLLCIVILIFSFF